MEVMAARTISFGLVHRDEQWTIEITNHGQTFSVYGEVTFDYPWKMTVGLDLLDTNKSPNIEDIRQAIETNLYLRKNL